MKLKEPKLTLAYHAIRAGCCPLVLHGASGVPDEAVVEDQGRICRLMSIPNWARVLPSGFMKYLKRIEPSMSVNTWCRLEALMEEVRAKIRLFGARGKAPGILEVHEPSDILNKSLWSNPELSQPLS